MNTTAPRHLHSVIAVCAAAMLFCTTASADIYLDIAAVGGAGDGAAWSSAYTNVADAITALNAANQKELFDKVFAARRKYFEDVIAKDPTQAKFRNGWLRRLNDFKFEP